jgi:hypothetical protein
MIAKPGKTPAGVTSYRPISLLPLLSKILEKFILRRLKQIIADNKLIPSHQFGFRTKHGAIEQVHGAVNKINDDMENKHFCSADLIDISQAFDKAWHTDYCTNLNMHSRTRRTPSLSLTFRIGRSRYDTKQNILHSTSTLGYCKVASSAPLFIPSSHRTYQKLNRRS